MSRILLSTRSRLGTYRLPGQAKLNTSGQQLGLIIANLLLSQINCGQILLMLAEYFDGISGLLARLAGFTQHRRWLMLDG